jgi:putative membrane protein
VLEVPDRTLQHSGDAVRWRDDPSVGTEPDYRFTLANERTFLAWIRTALGLLAGGVAVHQLVETFGVRGARTGLALGAIALSAVLAAGGYLRWVAVQRAVRRGQPLPAAPLVPILAVALVTIAVTAFVLIASE